MARTVGIGNQRYADIREHKYSFCLDMEYRNSNLWLSHEKSLYCPIREVPHRMKT